MAVRLVRDDPEGDASGTISADGRYLSCNDWSTGNAGICDLVTGEKKVLTQYGNWEEDDAWKKSGFTDMNIISSDGKQIAFTYYTGARLPNATVELRVMDSDGTGERTLYSKSPYRDGGWIIPDAWSSDGKHILARIHLPGEGGRPPNKGRYAIVLVSVADGSLRRLKELESPRRYRRRTFLSRDGSYVAYDFPPNQEVADGDVFILPVAGGEAVPVAPHPADDYVLGWAPDGGTLLFASNRSGSFGIWSVIVKEGKPIGEPELIRSHVGAIMSAGFDSKGTLYYALESEPTNAYFATIAQETGKAVGSPRRVTHRFSGSNDWAAWSPDGTQIAYRTWQGPADKSGMKISIRSVATNSEREIVPQLASFSRLRWHADGKSLLVVGRPRNAPALGLYRVDSRSGETTLLATESSSEITGWTRDASQVILQVSKPARVVRKNLDGGREAELYQLPEGDRRLHVGAISPDGRTVAIVRISPENDGRLTMVSVETGEVRELSELRDAELKGAWYRHQEGLFAWSPDSRYIYFVLRGKGKIYRIPAQGGEAVETGLIRGVWSDDFTEDELDARRIRGISVGPDGKRISFSVQEKWEFGLWAMENFLPKLRAAK